MRWARCLSSCFGLPAGWRLGIIIGMKALMAFVALLGVLGLSGCRLSDVREMTVEAPGMVAEQDAKRIRAVLEALPGIDRERTVFDLAGRRIKVVYDSMVIAHKNIEIAIAEAGYDANSIPAVVRPPAGAP